VKHIDLRQKTISVQGTTGMVESLSYDQLVIGTGAVPVRPEIEGTNLLGVYELHTMEDSFKVKEHLKKYGATSAIIIGTGYIGVEMADALSHLDLKVTLVGRSRVVFPSVDPEFGGLIESGLRKHGVEVVNGKEVAKIESIPSGFARNG
jgi:NADPH-dependent 2,4-dienoyl-CoA reductase/sulfur reductase-like enzyme